MAQYRVTGPDGATYNVTAPDNATPEQIRARVQIASLPKQNAPSGSMMSNRKPQADLTKLYMQGATFGLADEIAGGAGVVIDAIASPFSKSIDFNPTNSYLQWRDAARADAEASRKANPWTGAALEFAGGLGRKPAQVGLAGVKTLAQAMKEGAKKGAGMGALAGFGYGEGAEGSVAGAGMGAAFGGLLGGTIPAAFRALEKPIRGAIDYFRPQSGVGRELVAKALQSSALSPRQAAQALKDAQGRGVPLSLADLSANLRGLGGAVSRQPGLSRELATNAVTERQAGQGERIRSALVRDLGPVANRFQVSDELMAQAQQKAAPLYDEAFQGGSLAPLEKQFQAAFNETGAEVAAARKALSQAQNAATVARAGVSRAGENVYANSAALPAARGADQGIAAAQQALQEAEQRHAANIARLQQAQADGSANAPGAIWSPRIQQFLDDPITKAGIARGIEVQRLEALAAGKRFNPTEYAITGVDDAGEPIVGAVPNMRLLDAAKRGLDDILDAYPKDVSGRALLDQRGRAVAQVKQALVSELDGLNPVYSSARAAYAGPVSQKAALQQGYKALNASDQELERMASRLGEDERQQFALGLRSALAESLDRRVDGADKAAALLGNPRKRKALAQIFGGEDGFNNFVQTLADERAANETFRKVTQGSDTARFLADDASVQDQSMLADAAGAAMKGAASDGWRGIVGELVNAGRDVSKFGAGKTGERAREDAAALLFETDPKALADRMRQAMHDQALRRLRSRTMNDRGAFGGGKAGQLAGAVSGVAVNDADPYAGADPIRDDTGKIIGYRLPDGRLEVIIEGGR